MRSHILVLPDTTKFSNKSFVFKKSVVRKGLPKVAVTGLGAGGPRFKSGRPDHNYRRYFLQLIKIRLHRKFRVEFRQAGGLVPQVIQSSRFAAFENSIRGKDRRTNSQIIKPSELIGQKLLGMEKIQGTLRILSSEIFEIQIGDRALGQLALRFAFRQFPHSVV